MTPIAARRIVLGLAIVAVGLAVIPRTPTVHLTLFVSPDAWELGGSRVLAAPIRAFDEANVRLRGSGPVIRIEAHDIDSGRAEAFISDHPRSSPDVWIPASSIWSRLVGSKHPSLVDFDQPSLVKSPQVLAVWEGIHLRLDHALGWADVHRFATDPAAWRDAAGPGAGPFRLAHLNPERSTSGLSAAVSEFSLGAGATDGLTRRDVVSGAGTVREIEGAIVHYGPTSSDILEQFTCYGRSYASMVYIQETSLLRFNDDGYDVPPGCRNERVTEDLVPVYPSDGTFVADYPCVVLHARLGADQRQRAAERFCAWLQDWLHHNPRHVEDFHFVPAGRLSGEGLPPQILAVPDGDVLDEVQDVWKRLRRPADVVIAIDTSESMEDELDAIRAELPGCLSGFVERDRVGLVSFGDIATEQVTLGRYEETRDLIVGALDRLFPKGGTALFDAVVIGLRDIRRVWDPSRITAVVVITDGVEAGDKSVGSHDVRDELSNDEMPVRVFVVEDGGDLRVDIERTLVGGTLGRSFRVADEVDPLVGDTPIAQLCAEVFSYF